MRKRLLRLRPRSKRVAEPWGRARGLPLFVLTLLATVATLLVAVVSSDRAGAVDTGFLSPTAEAADTSGDNDGFELNPTDAFADDVSFASNVDGAGDRHRYNGCEWWGRGRAAGPPAASALRGCPFGEGD